MAILKRIVKRYWIQPMQAIQVLNILVTDFGETSTTGTTTPSPNFDIKGLMVNGREIVLSSVDNGVCPMMIKEDLCTTIIGHSCTRIWYLPIILGEIKIMHLRQG